MFHFTVWKNVRGCTLQLRNNVYCGNVLLKASKLSPIAHNAIVSNWTAGIIVRFRRVPSSFFFFFFLLQTRYIAGSRVCRYRAREHRNLEGWYTSRYTDCFVTPVGDSPVTDFTNAANDRWPLYFCAAVPISRKKRITELPRRDYAPFREFHSPVTANRRVNRILSSAIRAKQTGSDVAYREKVIAAPCV